MQPTVLIIGAGYSGALLAAQLLWRTSARVRLVERSGAFGPGLAYATDNPAHLLNVRTARMSAVPDQADHYVRWLQTHHPGYADPQGFTPRGVYGAYIAATLDDADRSCPGRLQRIVAEAVSVEVGSTPARVRFADGAIIEADQVVLALGNNPPDPRGAAGLSPESSERLINNPWAAGAFTGVRPADEVLVLGTGLTMIDAMLALEGGGWIGRATALSRRGLLPRAHSPHASQGEVQPRAPGDGLLSVRTRLFRKRAAEIGWGRAMDEIRPFNPAIWRGLEQRERERFLRHLRPWWDVHRHRSPPDAAERLRALIEAGSLTVEAGRIVATEARSGGIWIEWRRRGDTGSRRQRFDRVINCTGPLMDLEHSPDRLHRALLEGGLARTDPLGLSIEVDAGLRVIARDGRANPRLWAVGPLTRAASWEVVAVPEIRAQVADLAERLGAGGA